GIWSVASCLIVVMILSLEDIFSRRWDITYLVYQKAKDKSLPNIPTPFIVYVCWVILTLVSS
ncbi:MAG: hypothetical protein QG641_1771, partial [Candidatus Poribacteria bacterium]|nr:hypothetical protein [Candidatus Poribacteria bacterium]